MEVVTALRRLGFDDKPGKGDHIKLFKLLPHKDGPVTIQTGVDGDHMGLSDVDRVRSATKLTDNAMWARTLSKKLTRQEYDDHLLAHEKSDLVLGFWKDKVEAEASKLPQSVPDAPSTTKRAAKAKPKAKP